MPPDPFPLASLAIAEAIAAHSFDLREMVLLDVLRRLSFGAGRCEAYIPRLDFFSKAARISRGNVSAIITRLKAQRVIEEASQYFYGFLLPIENWKVAPRLEQVEIVEQLLLLETPPHLPGALRRTFVEQYSRPVAGTESSVPESGTLPISAPDHGARSRIGNDSLAPVFAGPSPPPIVPGDPPVPESGTLFKALKSSVVQSYETTETLKGTPFPNREHSLTPLDHDLRRDLAAFLGEKTWANWGGYWTNRLKEDRGLVERVYFEARNQVREGRPMRNRGGFMYDLFRRWDEKASR